MITIILLLTFTADAKGNKFKPQCYNDFLYNGAFINRTYKNSWKRNCKENVQKACRKNITVSYFEMEPFSTADAFTYNKWPTSGVLQQIISVALSQCCGSCINITFNKVNNRSELIDSRTKEISDIIFPVFSQGTPYRVNATFSYFNVPIIHLSGAMFITKSVISAKIFATEVIKAIIDIWPLLGVSILLAYAAGVLIWIIETWSNREDFPRIFIRGSFEGKHLLTLLKVNIY